MNFFFPPHSRVQSWSTLRGVARAHFPRHFGGCGWDSLGRCCAELYYGTVLGTLLLLSLAIKKVHRKVGQNLYPNTVPQYLTNHRASLKRHVKVTDKQILPTMLTLHRWILYKGQNTNKRVRVVCDKPTPYFRLLQTVLYYLRPPLLGEESYWAHPLVLYRELIPSSDCTVKCLLSLFSSLPSSNVLEINKSLWRIN